MFRRGLRKEEAWVLTAREAIPALMVKVIVDTAIVLVDTETEY